MERSTDLLSRILEKQIEMQWMLRKRLEAIMQVKVFRGIVFCVNKQSSNSKSLGRTQYSKDSILEHACSQAFGLMVLVNGQARQECSRDGMPRLTFLEPTISRIKFDLRSSQAIVAHYLRFIQGNECFCGTALVVRKGITEKKFIQ